MSKYYEPIRQLANHYRILLEHKPRDEWRSTDHYASQFLENLLLKIDAEVNDYQLNREISYATRLMVELRHTSVSTERKFYLQHFWPLDGEDPTEKVPSAEEE